MNIIRLMFYITLLCFNGCSIHSSQYNFIKSQIKKEDNQFKPNWKVYWIGQEKDVYAINDDDYIYFANFDGFILSFDGWQTREVVGLFANDLKMVINKEGAELKYFTNNTFVANNRCEEWSEELLLNKIKMWKQICYDEIIDYNYTNNIAVNSEGQVIGLRYKLNPNYPAIMLKLNKHKGLEF